MTRRRYLLFLLFGCVLCSPEIKQLPNCKEAEEKTKRSLLYVSTLDGKLSALDLSRNGELKWTVDFLETPLLTSNIDRREMNFNGQAVRVIPSLKGGLYKFDGENLEAIPVSIEQLLSSSYRYSDDLIFSGGQETKTYVIATSSGKIIKQCEMKQCTNAVNGSDLTDGDTLIIHHHHRTIRASELRSGVERWNFSVGQHDLTLVPPENSSCHHKQSAFLDIDIRVIIPEGLVMAQTKKTRLWDYKFDSPIVSIWREDQVEVNTITPLKKVDIFNLSLDSDGESELSIHPGLYIGMHNRQLYVQENPFLQKTIHYSENKIQMKYPWKPYPAIEFSESSNINETKEMSDLHSTTSLSVLYNSEYINGNGFYLYAEDQADLEEKQCNGTGPQNASEENESQSETIKKIDENPTLVFEYHADIWYWWKEILMIVITSLSIFGFSISCIQFRFYRKVETRERIVEIPVYVGTDSPSTKESCNIQVENDDANNRSQSFTFQSHYEDCFKPLNFLGRGGYGIVFAATHKTDQANYAIKRITLPNQKSRQDRALREAQVLAQLDHPHIIRYCASWIESAPPGWQEEHDKLWDNDPNFPKSNITETSVNPSVNIKVNDIPSIDSAQEALKFIRKNNDFNLQDKTSESSGIFDYKKKNEDLSSTTEEDDSDSYTNNTENSYIEENTKNINDGAKDGCFSIDHSVSLNVETTNESIVFQKSQALSHDTKNESVIFENSCDTSSENISKSEIIYENKRDFKRVEPKTYLYIQMQLCKQQNLKQWLDQNKTRKKSYILNMFIDIVDAVDYVHKKSMIHRDLKTSNIFFTLNKEDEESRIVIGDFGLVTISNDSIIETQSTEQKSKLLTAEVGTFFYMAPELQKNVQNYNNKVDIYSLGIILFEMLIPFDTESERYHVLKNLRDLIFPKDFISKFPDEYSLLMKMLHENPTERPTATVIKERLPSKKMDLSPTKSNPEDSKHLEFIESR